MKSPSYIQTSIMFSKKHVPINKSCGLYLYDILKISFLTTSNTSHCHLLFGLIVCFSWQLSRTYSQQSNQNKLKMLVTNSWAHHSSAFQNPTMGCPSHGKKKKKIHVVRMIYEIPTSYLLTFWLHLLQLPIPHSLLQPHWSPCCSLTHQACSCLGTFTSVVPSA